MGRSEVRRYGEVEVVLGWDEYDLFIEGPIEGSDLDWLRAIRSAGADGLRVLDPEDVEGDEDRVRLLLAERGVA